MSDIDMNVPWVESPFFETLLPQRKLTAEDERLARHYHERGFAILENLIPELEARAIIEEAAPLYTAAPDGPRSRYRAQDGWRESAAIAKVAAHPRVLRTLEMLYGRRPIPFQTLNFRHGSQQSGHSDQMHFSSLPPRFMCGVWVALEDVTSENGPLFYHPGSHRLPEYDLEDLDGGQDALDYARYERFIAALMQELRFPREQLLVKAGTALIWASNIVHGGMPIARPGATRHSQVTHYYFQDCIYYTPVFSNRKLGQFALREETIDVRTGDRVIQSYNGIPFRTRALPNGRKVIELQPPERRHMGSLERLIRDNVDLASPLGRTLRLGWRTVKALRK